ncbi:hypothetical protein GJ496_008748 [Pomphorhynchus laevis]|nr:hypothetical protein GJ496_008748 [Pomphorhynchus laevis]
MKHLKSKRNLSTRQQQQVPKLVKHRPIILICHVMRILLIFTVLFLDLPCIRAATSSINVDRLDFYRSTASAGFNGYYSSQIMTFLNCYSISARLTLVCAILNIICIIDQHGSLEKRHSASDITKLLQWKFVIFTIQTLLYAVYCDLIVLEDTERFTFCMVVNLIQAVSYIWQFANVMSIYRCRNEQRRQRNQPPISTAKAVIDDITKTIKSFSINDYSSHGDSVRNTHDHSTQTTVKHKKLIAVSNKSTQLSYCTNCRRLWMYCHRQHVLIIILMMVCLTSVFFNGVFVSLRLF